MRLDSSAALGRTEYQNFLELETGWNRNPNIEPVPKKNEDKLREVFRYIYGSKQDSIPPLVRSQNPHLKQVGEVLAHPVALEKVRAGASLDIAHNEVRTPY